ncbi:MAG: TetR/AcrR family transcriptional regulator [Betaproteobacteria bacterium]|jgi:AcrR family transcriptional regulator
MPLSTQTSPLTANDLRGRILMASRQCFSKRGFDLTTLGDIQQAAGVSRGAIYHHFRSKEEIIQVITSENLGRMGDKVAEILTTARTEHLPVAKAVEHLCVYVEEIVFGPGQAMGIRVWAASTVDPGIRSTMVTAFERIRSLMVELIANYQQRGEIDARANPEQLACALFAITIPGFQVQRLFLDERSVDPKTYAQALLDMLKPQGQV